MITKSEFTTIIIFSTQFYTMSFFYTRIFKFTWREMSSWPSEHGYLLMVYENKRGEFFHSQLVYYNHSHQQFHIYKDYTIFTISD